MSRRLKRFSLALAFLLSSEAFAIGLGDIHLDSALNEPLRAEIELLSATPEELANLQVTLASAETFERYGIDRPFYLQELAFNVTTGPNGPVVQIRSPSPVTEPFLTFLVEATWSAGRLLREYTVLLDPPTYTPPAVQQTQPIQAPTRATPTDSARIERQPSPPPQQQQQQPVYTPPTRQAEPPPPPMADEAPAYEPPAYDPSPDSAYETPYSTTTGGDYYVERGDTLWGITSRLLPDGRLTMNQAMVAIFEANPDAFLNNINRLKAGVTLRIPSADSVFQIERATAFDQVKRMNDEWRGGTASDEAVADTSFDDTTYDDTSYDSTYDDEPAYEDTPAFEDETPFEDDTSFVDDTSVADETTTETTDYDSTFDDSSEPVADMTDPATETTLELVPPEEDPLATEFDDDAQPVDDEARRAEILEEISALEAADVPEQQSLIEIRDNRLAELRHELAVLNGEVPADDVDPLADEPVDAAPEPSPTTVVTTSTSDDEGIVDMLLGFLSSIYLKIGAAVVLAVGLLLWFLRRSGGGDEESEWETLDSDVIAEGAMSATETLQAPSPDEGMVVVEEGSGIRPLDDTIEAPEPEMAPPSDLEETTEAEATDFAGLQQSTGDTGSFDSLEDTFSSETAVNLDQTDPLAEADFHMAYGLYDQAADLVNGALEQDPGDKALMSKLCEIYFVWGNRDAFIDAATNLKGAVGDGDSSEWDKIVIMGQQIAGDHELFAGARVAGATKAVDLSFEGGMDDAGELDMDFGGAETSDSEVLDLGSAADDADDGGDALDFAFGDDDSDEADDTDAVAEVLEPTAEMPAAEEPTVETPTIEEQFTGMDGTAELPSLDDDVESAIAASGQESDATAEINLDELDLDIDGLAETELASLDDLDATGTNEALTDLADITGKNPEIDPDATGVQQVLDPVDPDATSMNEALDMGLDSETSETGLYLAPDETGRMPTMDTLSETDTTIDADLLDATGKTQVLSEDFAVETGVDVGADLGDDDATMLAPGYGDDDEDEGDETAIAGDAETLLAPMDDDEEDFDFAKTEALPPEAFTSNTSLDETGEMPAPGETDMDLDLDDLTAALKVSEVGDTVEQLRDDATVEQPRPSMSEETAEVPTMSLGPEDMSDDLHEARTMTEVGTKLDLARAYVDMGDPAGARSILEEVLDEGDEGQKQQAQQLLDSLPS